MIAKVPKRRADGRSSFGSLVAYIAQSASSLVCGDGLWSAETAAREMDHIARANGRCLDPVYHYVLSWPHPERPADDQAIDVARTTLEDLGLAGHQWVAAIHRNTGHVHIHVAVNRIHPTTLRAVTPRRDWLTLDRACRNAELKYGWSHDRGPHIVVTTDSKAMISRKEPERSNAPIHQSAGARDFSAWTGLESFQAWIAAEPARQLYEAIQSPSRSWQTVHEILRMRNLAYQLKGSGAIVVDLASPNKFSAKASHLGRWASLSRLKMLLGPYEPSRTIDVSQIGPANSHEAHMSYRSHVDGPRLEPVLRRHQRDLLFERFTRDQADWQSVALPKHRAMCLLQRRSDIERQRRLQTSTRIARDRIRQTPAAGAQGLLLSLVSLRSSLARQQLRFDIQQERIDLRAARNAAAPGGWTKWLRNQALAGDEQAVRRLRRLAMRERRHVDLGSAVEVGSLNSIQSPRSVKFDQYRVVVRATSIDYCKSGRLAFRDDGRRLALYSESHDEVRASLILAREKWGLQLSISGSERFRHIATNLATNLGMSILDREDFGNGHHSKAALDEIQRISREVGKPYCILPPRFGSRYTGKLMAIISVTRDETTVVLDIGRTIGAFSWNLSAAAGRELLGGHSIVTAHSICRETSHPIWRFLLREQSRRPPDIGLP